MKHSIFLLAAFYFLFNACSNPKDSETGAIPNPTIDSIKVDAIDTIMYHQGRDWRPGPHFHRAQISGRDTVEYTEKNGIAERISAHFYTDTTATWVTAHQVNNELVLVRFRQWRAKPQSNVQETLSYFENGKIFYSKERNKILGPNDQLGSFREATFVENARPIAELKAEYEPYWNLTIVAVQKDLQLQGK